MTSPPERRKHRRLEIRLPLEYSFATLEDSLTYRTVTGNISTGGIYFEIEGKSPDAGGRLNLELTVPPGTHFPYRGRVSTVAEVTRVIALAEPLDSSDQVHPQPSGRFGVGARLESWVLSF